MRLGLNAGIAGSICIMTHCIVPSMKCMMESVCHEALTCIQGADYSKPGQMLNCEVRSAMKGSISELTTLTECIYENGCQPMMPDDGVCKVDHTSGQANLTDPSAIEGEWWAIKGFNPHYDNLRCQHNRYHFDKASQQWVNNVTWVDDDVASKPVIGTIPTVTAPYPGYFVHVYPEMDQTEPWVVVSKPHDDYMVMLWCGENPAMKYAGGIVVSKHKTADGMPKWVDDAIRERVTAHGIDYDKWFLNDNSECIDGDGEVAPKELDII